MSQKIYSCDMCAIKSTTQIPCEHPFCEMVKLLPDEENTGAHSYTESAYKEFDPHLPCVPAKKEPDLERLAGKLKPNYNHAQRIKPVESSEPQEKEQYEEITSASNVIRFLSEYIHGINNGRRKESIDLLLLNAADHFKRLPVSAPSESVEDHAKRFAEWLRKNNWSAIPKSDQHWFNILSGEKLRTTNDLYSDFTRNP